MNIKNPALILALLGSLGATASAQAVVVTDGGLIPPTTFETGQLTVDNRFGFDDQEKFGQEFTLAQPATLGSIWIAYNGFVDRTGTFLIEIDAGNDGTADLTEMNIALDGANFSGATTDGNTGPFYWMQWDLSSYNLLLPAGQSMFTIKCTGEGPAGAATWLFAPCYALGTDLYPGGMATGDLGLNPGNDCGFAITAPASNPGSAYCFGDSTGASCPCSAFGGTGEGCANTTGTGAVLTGSGSASFSNDTFQLAITGVPGSKPGLILRGDNQVAVPAGDGILCTAGGSMRSHVQVTVAGATTFTDFNGSPLGSVANSGASTNFQFWYRDPSNTCSGGGFNFTNGWTVDYMP